MLRAANGFLSAEPSFQLGVISFLLVAIVGAIDLSTGYELSFSIFYAIPVGIASWYAGKRLGFFVCVISAMTWLAADYASGHQYSHPTIPLWNASVRLCFSPSLPVFSITSTALSIFRNHLRNKMA